MGDLSDCVSLHVFHCQLFAVESDVAPESEITNEQLVKVVGQGGIYVRTSILVGHVEDDVPPAQGNTVWMSEHGSIPPTLERNVSSHGQVI